LVSDQKTHFINKAIEIFTNNFLLRHTTSTTYYPHSNGQVESTHKIIGSLLTKLVNENQTDWDEHLHMVLYAYWTSFKVTTGHTLFQLVYGLYPLMPTKYMLPTNNSHPNQDFSPTHILTNHMAKLEHLDENHQEATNRTDTRQWNTTLQAQQNHEIKTLGDIILWFPMGRKEHTGKLKK